MPLARLRVDGVRCLADARLELDPERNVIAGPNGAGKTSLLESIHLLARGRSFRTRQARRIVQNGRASFHVVGEMTDAHGGLDRVGVGFGHSGLEIRVNGRAAAGMAELAGLLVVHVVDPSAHALIEGGPSVRRRFLDGGVFHVEHSYLGVWRHYRRLLGQRNAALKAKAGGAELGAWTVQLAAAGIEIDRARRDYVRRLASELGPLGQRLLGTALDLEYRSGWRQGIGLAEALAESESRDRQSGLTQVGPHRADLGIRMEGGRVDAHASRGQQKLIAAGLVVAEAACLSAAQFRNGIILVDDPAAELDRSALGRLVSEIDALPVQRVFTGLEVEPLSAGGGRVFHVEQGRVHPML